MKNSKSWKSMFGDNSVCNKCGQQINEEVRKVVRGQFVCPSCFDFYTMDNKTFKMKPRKDGRNFYSIAEMSDALKLTVENIHVYIKRGHLRSEKFSTLHLIWEDDINEFLNRYGTRYLSYEILDKLVVR